MASYRFQLQHTGRPFGPSETIPDGAWREVSKHTTFQAARKARASVYAAMTSASGVNAWDDHYRIVALRDTGLTFNYFCLGPIDCLGKRPSDCADNAAVWLEWPAGTPEPSAPIPDGWESAALCGACARIEQEGRAHIED